MARIAVKTGETFNRNCKWMIDDIPVNLTSYQIVSRGQSRDGKYQPLTVVILDQTTNPGEFTIAATPEQTALWLIGEIHVDVSFRSAAGVVEKSATFIVYVEQSPTP